MLFINARLCPGICLFSSIVHFYAPSFIPLHAFASSTLVGIVICVPM